MTLLRHELRAGLRAGALWGLSLGALILTVMLLYPQVEGQAQLMKAMLQRMGPLTAAFGLDRLDYATPIGFYALEAGNFIGLGGSVFAAMAGMAILAKEEGRHTAEFLMPHPLSRCWMVTQKLLALWIQILLLSILLAAVSLLAFALIKRPVPRLDFARLQLVYLLLMLQIGTVCFGLSAFLRREAPGLGIGLALISYFLNILVKLSPSVDFFRFVTPHYYADAATVLHGGINRFFVLLGVGISALFLLAGYVRYLKKDLVI